MPPQPLRHPPPTQSNRSGWATAPDATLTSIDGRTQSFSSIYKNHPTIVIFYRGGWCPYCNRHLSDVATAQPTLRELGYQIIAISPDKPEELRKTMDKDELAYQLFSDSDMTLAPIRRRVRRG